jgi:hypothetical protein
MTDREPMTSTEAATVNHWSPAIKSLDGIVLGLSASDLLLCLPLSALDAQTHYLLRPVMLELLLSQES